MTLWRPLSSACVAVECMSLGNSHPLHVFATALIISAQLRGSLIEKLFYLDCRLNSLSSVGIEF